MLRYCRNLSRKTDSIFSEFQYLVETKPTNINSVSWKQFFNCLNTKTVSNLSFSQLNEIIQHFAKFPNCERFHDILDIVGNRVLSAVHAGMIPPEVATSISRSYLEAGLHVASPECMRYRKRQVETVRDTARELIPKLVAVKDSAYVVALAVQQGYVGRDQVEVGTIIDKALGLPTESPLSVRAETAWALSLLGSGDTETTKQVAKLFTLRDLQLFQYDSNLTSLPLIPRRDWFRVVQLFDATRGTCTRTSETVTSCLSDKATVCGTMASNSLWWRAISGGRFDPVAAQCMRTCMDKVDFMPEVEKWKARNALMYFETIPIHDTELGNQLAYCNRNDILGMPKRAAVAWRHVGGSRNSSRFHS
jgi:hypothetical protein